MDNRIEKGILPLVEAIRSLDFADTVYSCEGHFDREPDERFLPTAYVTFGVDDLGRFRLLYDRLSALAEASEPAALRLTYDCILGRYTLSIWPDNSLESPSEKRVAADSVIRLVAEAVSGFARREEAVNPSRDCPQCRNASAGGCTQLRGALVEDAEAVLSPKSGTPIPGTRNHAERDLRPIKTRVPGISKIHHEPKKPFAAPEAPCMFVIPFTPFKCPFTDFTADGLGNSR